MPKLALCLVLAEVGGGGGPVDPGFGVPAPGGPGIDNTLPGGGGHPWLPGMIGGIGGGRPDQGLPGGGWGGGHPDQGLPGGGGRPPHISNRPPGSRPPLPSHPIYKPIAPIPPGVSPGGGMWVIAYIPGRGFNWVAVTPGVPEKPQPPEVAPPDPANPDNTLPSVPVDPEAPTPAPTA